jgi:hypothetical protein
MRFVDHAHSTDAKTADDGEAIGEGRGGKIVRRLARRRRSLRAGRRKIRGGAGASDLTKEQETRIAPVDVRQYFCGPMWCELSFDVGNQGSFVQTIGHPITAFQSAAACS